MATITGAQGVPLTRIDRHRGPDPGWPCSIQKSTGMGVQHQHQGCASNKLRLLLQPLRLMQWDQLSHPKVAASRTPQLDNCFTTSTQGCI